MLKRSQAVWDLTSIPGDTPLEYQACQVDVELIHVDASFEGNDGIQTRLTVNLPSLSAFSTIRQLKWTLEPHVYALYANYCQQLPRQHLHVNTQETAVYYQRQASPTFHDAESPVDSDYHSETANSPNQVYSDQPAFNTESRFQTTRPSPKHSFNDSGTFFLNQMHLYTASNQLQGGQEGDKDWQDWVQLYQCGLSNVPGQGKFICRLDMRQMRQVMS